MTEWSYKANETLATLAQTRELLEQDRFIARSAYTKASAKPPLVWSVKLGHVIYVYYKEGEAPLLSLGAWEVTLPKPGRDAGFVQGSGLVRVADAAFVAKWCGEGLPYTIDPVLKVLTGWSLKPREDLTPPPPRWIEGGRQTLRKYVP